MTELFAEANQGWDLSKLYLDISAIKGLPLTDWEKTCLRGLLCRYSPKAIAAKTYWTGSSLRTELSRRLYPCLANLTNKERIVWHKIADDLASMGYKNLDKLKDDIALASAATTVQVLAVSVVITSAIRCTSNKVVSQSVVEMAEKAYQRGNLLSRAQDYPAALECYHLALKSLTMVDINILINIARCYDRLKKYSDSLAICYFALNYISDSNHTSNDQCRIYNFIAGVFHELAITHRDKSYLNPAIDYYTKAALSSQSDILPVWNQVDLILNCVKEQIVNQSAEKKLYLVIAHQKMELLLEISRQGTSYTRYRDRVLDDMCSAFDGLDISWQKYYYRFQNIGV
jgi:tetratricopeptide (TPR) repeat protein